MWQCNHNLWFQHNLKTDTDQIRSKHKKHQTPQSLHTVGGRRSSRCSEVAARVQLIPVFHSTSQFNFSVWVWERLVGSRPHLVVAATEKSKLFCSGCCHKLESMETVDADFSAMFKGTLFHLTFLLTPAEPLPQPGPSLAPSCREHPPCFAVEWKDSPAPGWWHCPAP